ncbi:MAG: hypothetical protein MK171_02285 [Pirellulales bacterium]|nr:hypothetical protein [Pirellulales bacterium]
MATNNRATLIAKVLKVLKRHYQEAEPSADRTLLEHLLYACCLENSLHVAANEVFARLSQDYFDWNEVRVSSVRELTTAMKALNDPKESAVRLKRVLQSLFETHYSFDLEFMKKQNIGQTVKQLEKYNGTTPFTVSFVTQNALSGHAIPINRGLLEAMRIVSVISDAEAAKGTIPGLERAVPKTKGVAVATILHQLGVELHRSPYGPNIRKLLLEINPSCKTRLPKRSSKKVEVSPQPKPVVPAKKAEVKTPPTEKSTSKRASTNGKTSKQAKPKSAVKPEKKTKVTKKKMPRAVKKATVKKATVKKATVKKATVKKATVKKAAVKKAAVKKAAGKKKVAKKKAKSTAKGKKKSSTKKLRKRKPK